MKAIVRSPHQKAVTMESARHQVDELKQTAKGYRLANQIAAEIADQYGLRMKDILGPCRRKLYVQCRKEIAKSLRDRLKLSLPEIGDTLNKNHTTILHYLRGKRSGSGF